MATSRLLKTPSAADAHTGNMKKKRQKFGDRGSLAQEMETGFIMKRIKSGENQMSLFSPEASPASLSPAPGSDEARRMTVTSGLKWLELYRKSGPVGSLAKTLLASSTWASTIAFLTWKPSVTKCKRLLFRLVPSVPRTEGTGCGLLATPQASDPVEGARTAVDSRRVCIGRELNRIAMLPTPQHGDYRNKDYDTRTSNLPNRLRGSGRYAEMLPTPASRDYKGANPNNPYDTLDSLVEVGATKNGAGQKTGLKLQPAFVE